MKRCGKCGELKPESDFYRHSSRTDRLQFWCKDCRRKANRAWRRANPDRELAHTLRNRFGITLAEYDSLLAAQGGACAICRRTPDELSKRLAVDHDHTTGRVRGLLCSDCNTALGLLRDEPKLLRNAIAYLVGQERP